MFSSGIGPPPPVTSIAPQLVGPPPPVTSISPVPAAPQPPTTTSSNVPANAPSTSSLFEPPPHVTSISTPPRATPLFEPPPPVTSIAPQLVGPPPPVPSISPVPAAPQPPTTTSSNLPANAPSTSSLFEPPPHVTSAALPPSTTIAAPAPTSTSTATTSLFHEPRSPAIASVPPSTTAAIFEPPPPVATIAPISIEPPPPVRAIAVAPIDPPPVMVVAAPPTVAHPHTVTITTAAAAPPPSAASISFVDHVAPPPPVTAIATPSSSSSAPSASAPSTSASSSKAKAESEPTPVQYNVPAAFICTGRLASTVVPQALFEFYSQQAKRIKASNLAAAEVRANGRDGRDGRSAIGQQPKAPNGRDGAAGQHDCDPGQRGGPGDQGRPGLPGENGEPGWKGDELWVALDGTPESLTLRVGDQNTAVSLADPATVLVISAQGGTGGRGGAGCEGGEGGDGGDGGDGARGADCRKPGKRGYKGGDGGDGGRGGNGGEGGRGGDGGSGGDGGVVTLEVHDPRLLMLVEVDVSPGIGGTGGKGGPGGRGGSGGKGGDGGPGGKGGPAWTEPNGRQHSAGRKGEMGQSGLTGDPGNRGVDAIDGYDGARGQYGAVIFRVVGSGPTPAPPSLTGSFGANSFTKAPNTFVGFRRFNCTMLGFTVCSSIEGISDGDGDQSWYMPGTLVLVRAIAIANDSDALPLPAGVRLEIEPHESLIPTPYYMELPEIPPSTSVECTAGALWARLRDPGEPDAPGPYRGSATISTKATLLGRVFRDAAMTHGISLRYPVHLCNLKVPSCISPGEAGQLSIEVHNTSTASFGTKCQLMRFFPSPVDATVASESIAADLVVRVLVHHGLKIESVSAQISDGGNQASNSTPLPLPLPLVSAGTDRTGVWNLYSVPIECLPAKSSMTLLVRARMGEETVPLAGHSVRVELVLQNRFIQYEIDAIRSVPWYRPSGATVLLMTGRSTTAPRYKIWGDMLHGLGLEFDTWDIDRQRGVSFDTVTGERHEPTWVGHTQERLIVMLADHAQQFELMCAYDLASHFLGLEWERQLFTGGGVLRSSMVCFNTSPYSVRDRAAAACSDVIAIGGEEFSDTSITGKIGFGGKLDEATKAAALRLVEKLQQGDERHHYSVRAIAPADAAGQAKRQFGTCYIGRSALDRMTTNLLACSDGAALAIEREFAAGSTLLHQSTPFTRALLYVTLALPPTVKMQLLLRLGTAGIVGSTPSATGAATPPGVSAMSENPQHPGNASSCTSVPKHWFTEAAIVGIEEQQQSSAPLPPIPFVDLLLGSIYYDLAAEFVHSPTELPLASQLFHAICTDSEHYFPIRVDAYRLLNTLQRKHARKSAIAIIQVDNKPKRKIVESLMLCMLTSLYGAEAAATKPDPNSMLECDKAEAKRRDEVRDLSSLAPIIDKLLAGKWPLRDALERTDHIFAPPIVQGQGQGPLQPFPCLKSSCENLSVAITGIVVPFHPNDSAQFVMTVKTDSRTWECRRTYDEFAELNNNIKRNWNMPLPPLPSSWSLFARKNSDKLLQSQRAGLDQFITAVVQDEELRQSSFVFSFLKVRRADGHDDDHDSKRPSAPVSAGEAATTSTTSSAGSEAEEAAQSNSEGPAMAGFLTMQEAGLLRTTWTCYWFELQATELVYYEASAPLIVDRHLETAPSSVRDTVRGSVIPGAASASSSSSYDLLLKKRKGAIALSDIVNVWPFRHEGLRLVGRQCFKLVIKAKNIPLYAERPDEATRWVTELRNALRLPDIVMLPLADTEVVGDATKAVYASAASHE